MIQYLELIGVAAFAITGATSALEKGTDIFGVLFLSLITALGGGVIRDLLLGYTPPRMFTSYLYVSVALLCGLVIFIGAYSRKDLYVKYSSQLDQIVNVFDALGLAVFTVSGLQLAADQYGMANPLLLTLMGMTTGVGGGMLRDVLIGTIPRVLRKRVYALASLSGAVMYYLLLYYGARPGISTALVCVFIVVLRVLATVFRWSLPRVKF